MSRIRALAVIGVVSLSLGGCMSSGASQQAGLAFVAPAGSAGGPAGNAIGASLDANDRQVAMDAEFRALEYGRAGSAVQWRGHNGRSHGDVVAGTRYQVNEIACRDYTHTIYVDDQPAVTRGTACRQTDGTWKAIG